MKIILKKSHIIVTLALFLAVTGSVALGIDRVQNVVPVKAALTGVSVTSSNSKVGATTSLTFTFSTAHELPAKNTILTFSISDGSWLLPFFGYADAPNAIPNVSLTCQGIDGTFNSVQTGPPNSVGFVRSGDGTVSPLGTKTCTVNNVKNPPASTLDSNGQTKSLIAWEGYGDGWVTVSDGSITFSDNGEIPRGSIVIQPADLENLRITKPASAVASDSTGDLEFSFVNKVPFYNASYIGPPASVIVTLPSGFSFNSGGQTTVSGAAPFTTLAISGQTATLTSQAPSYGYLNLQDIAWNPEQTLAIKFTNIKFPSSTPQTENFSIKTTYPYDSRIISQASIPASSVTINAAAPTPAPTATPTTAQTQQTLTQQTTTPSTTPSTSTTSPSTPSSTTGTNTTTTGTAGAQSTSKTPTTPSSQITASTTTTPPLITSTQPVNQKSSDLEQAKLQTEKLNQELLKKQLEEKNQPVYKAPETVAKTSEKTPTKTPEVDPKKFAGFSVKNLKIADRNLKAELKDLIKEYKTSLLGEDDEDVIKEINAAFQFEKKRIQMEQKLVKKELPKAKARETAAKKSTVKKK